MLMAQQSIIKKRMQNIFDTKTTCIMNDIF